MMVVIQSLEKEMHDHLDIEELPEYLPIINKSNINDLIIPNQNQYQPVIMQQENKIVCHKWLINKDFELANIMEVYELKINNAERTCIVKEISVNTGLIKIKIVLTLLTNEKQTFSEIQIINDKDTVLSKI